jgi:hypothetical protein
LRGALDGAGGVAFSAFGHNAPTTLEMDDQPAALIHAAFGAVQVREEDRHPADTVTETVKDVPEALHQFAAKFGRGPGGPADQFDAHEQSPRNSL